MLLGDNQAAQVWGVSDRKEEEEVVNTNTPFDATILRGHQAAYINPTIFEQQTNFPNRYHNLEQHCGKVVRDYCEYLIKIPQVKGNNEISTEIESKL